MLREETGWTCRDGVEGEIKRTQGPLHSTQSMPALLLYHFPFDTSDIRLDRRLSWSTLGLASCAAMCNSCKGGSHV